MSGYVLTDTEREALRRQADRIRRFLDEHEGEPMTFTEVMALGDELDGIMDDVGMPKDEPDTEAT